MCESREVDFGLATYVTGCLLPENSGGVVQS